MKDKKSLCGRLQRDEAVIGSWINSGSPIVAELMAATGFDFLTVDVEHSAVDLPQVQQIFQAIRSGKPDCAALVRLPGCDYAGTKRYLDAGAEGVIAPLINTAKQARELVSAVKYPPLGNRGVGFCRDNQYGMNLQARVAKGNEEKLVAVQIEHVEGVRNIDDIFAVPGIDVAFIGPYDLSASMGITAQFDHPRMLEAKQEVLLACRKHGIVPGIHVVQPDVDEVVARFSEGYRLIAYSLDITMLLNACARGVAEIRSRIGNQADARSRD
jgi:2-dehydro-3-deoxyglucarate aldolase